MAVPKRRMSRANTHARRSQWKASVPQLVACPHCGQYNGRRAVTPA